VLSRNDLAHLYEQGVEAHLTPTDVVNLALDLLKEAPITSVDEPRSIAMWCKRNFDVTRDALLEEADWNFAMKRAKIAEDSDKPAFGWCRQFTIPPDCVRVVPLTHNGAPEGRPVQFEVENGKILTNESGPLPVRYVGRTEEYDRYPATFVTALSAKLATKMAHWLTGKSNYVQIASGLYQDAMNKAWLSDAIQGTVPRAADDQWVDAR
jgi:hypothetical protein